MSNPNIQSIPDPDDRQAGQSSDRLASGTGDQNIYNRFLQDIASEKHIPELKHAGAKSTGTTLIEAIFNATVVRTFSLTVQEFRLLGASFINRSVLFGLSKEFGQSPFLNALKGEIKEGLHNLDHLPERRGLRSQTERQIKDKSLQDVKEMESKEKLKKMQAKPDHKALITDNEPIANLNQEKKPERIPSQEDKTETEPRRYNISNTIRKATELELSMIPSTEHNKNVFQKLEQARAAEAGGAKPAPDNLNLSTDRLKYCIEQFSKGKILVLGDLLIDELLEGRPERISREAPVLILEHVDTVLIPGGAANAAHNVTALGGKCHAIGVCGQDEYAQKLIQLLDKHGISHNLVANPMRPTTVKTRILSKTHALMQQLLRLDRISRAPISGAIEALVIEKLESAAKQYPVLILSDYRAGITTDEVIHACKKITQTNNSILIVDAQDKFERFQNVNLLTPNQPDTEQAVGYPINNQSDLVQAGEDMLLLTGAQAILMTRSKEGMTLFRRGSTPFSLPAFNRLEVYDVSGAGDTVVATIALALSTGATLPEAIALGNIAASIVVTKPGTAVTSQKEMIDMLPLLQTQITKGSTSL